MPDKHQVPKNSRFVSVFSTFNRQNCIPPELNNLMEIFPIAFLCGVARALAHHLSIAKIAHEFNYQLQQQSVALKMPSPCFHIRQKWNESRHFSIAFRLRMENNDVSVEQHIDVGLNEMPFGTYKIQSHTHAHTHITLSHMTQKCSNMLAIRIWNGYALCTSYDWFIIIVLAKRSQIKTMCPWWWCWLRLRWISLQLLLTLCFF